MVEATTVTALEVRARGLAGAHMVFLMGGAEVAAIRSSHWRTRAYLSIDGHEFVLERESIFGRFVLRADDRLLATATKRSAFRNVFDIALGETSITLRREGIFSSRFLLEHDGNELGEIRKTGVLRKRAMAQLPTDWPLPLQIFAVWLAWSVWRKEAAAAGG